MPEPSGKSILPSLKIALFEYLSWEIIGIILDAII
jgi:hypothetical protein